MKAYLSLALMMGLMVSDLPAQKNITWIGGVTYSTVRHNNSQRQKVAGTELLTGIVVGTESKWGDLRLGGLFIQQGFVSEVQAGDGVITGSERFNYLMPYLIYVRPLNERTDLFGGFGLGTAMGGQASGADGESTLAARLFNLDTQVMFGFDVTLSPHLTLRSNVFVGLRDVVAILDPEFNYKNQSVSMAFKWRQ